MKEHVWSTHEAVYMANRMERELVRLFGGGVKKSDLKILEKANKKIKKNISEPCRGSIKKVKKIYNEYYKKGTKERELAKSGRAKFRTRQKHKGMEPVYVTPAVKNELDRLMRNNSKESHSQVISVLLARSAKLSKLNKKDKSK